jgi:pSer/pThr/pTyr-binding forkhead associated (FHA) protein
MCAQRNCSGSTGRAVVIDTRQDPRSAPAPAPPDLIIRCRDVSYAARADGRAVTIGREPPAHLVVDDPRISRAHLRVQPDKGGWVAVDNSRNGTYVDGTRQASFVIADGMTVMLGETDGIPVTFAFDDASERTAALTSGPVISDEERTHWVPEGETDEGIARAGTAVAARREQLGIAQRGLARNKIMNAGALIAFEKGRSWPRKQTLAKLEDVLQWPPGMISRIRYGATSPYDETTEALSNSIRAPLMAQTIELALSTLGSTIAALPDPADTDFGPRVGAVLADLRRLESMAANAARSARGAPEIAIALSTVRKRYDELMLRAARAPKATLGQRLYAARRRAELTVEEVANATGLSVELITGAEADGPIGPSTSATLESFIGMLAAR